MMIATCVHGDPNYRIGIFFANWSLVACSDNSAKEYVMLMIVAVVTLTVRAPLISSFSVMICFART